MSEIWHERPSLNDWDISSAIAVSSPSGSDIGRVLFSLEV